MLYEWEEEVKDDSDVFACATVSMENPANEMEKTSGRIDLEENEEFDMGHTECPC